MQIVAVCTPRDPAWRWRIVDDSGDMLEESSLTFPSIDSAVEDGRGRLHEREKEDVARAAHQHYRR